MNSWLTYEQVTARHQERIREAEHSRLVRAVVQAQPEPPMPLARWAGSALTATGAWLTDLGCRLQTDPAGIGWQGAEEPCYEAAGNLLAD
jgi:hypothetical protein